MNRCKKQSIVYEYQCCENYWKVAEYHMLISKGKDLNQFQAPAKGDTKVNLRQMLQAHWFYQWVRSMEKNTSAAKGTELFSNAKKRWRKTRKRRGGTTRSKKLLAAQQLWQLSTWTPLYKEWHKCLCLEEGYTVISFSLMPLNLPTDIFTFK